MSYSSVIHHHHTNYLVGPLVGIWYSFACSIYPGIKEFHVSFSIVELFNTCMLLPVCVFLLEDVIQFSQQFAFQFEKGSSGMTV